jgi:hypothetical protein
VEVQIGMKGGQVRCSTGGCFNQNKMTVSKINVWEKRIEMKKTGVERRIRRKDENWRKRGFQRRDEKEKNMREEERRWYKRGEEQHRDV